MNSIDKLSDEFADILVKAKTVMEVLNHETNPKNREVYRIVCESLEKRINEIGNEILELSKQS